MSQGQRWPGAGHGEVCGIFDIFEGPCCDEPACPSRECWPYPGESREQMLARLRRKYDWAQPITTTEDTTDGN